MTEKIDFSQLVNDNESLISWEDLFPEYAVGGESFKSGQSHTRPETGLSSSAQGRGQSPSLTQKPAAYETYNRLDNVQPKTSYTSSGMSLSELPALPEIPLLMDDDIIMIPDEESTPEPVISKPITDMTEWLGDMMPDNSVPQNKTADFNMDEDWITRALMESDNLFQAANQSVKDQDYWANRFNQLNFPGMDLMAVSYFGSSSYDLLEQHMLLKRVTRDFVRLLGYNSTMELRSAGVSEEGIFYMKKGKIPENFTVHLKYPLEYGGTIDFGNMVLMQDKPFHDMIHSYLDEQMITPTGISYPPLLYVPTPVGKIYVPFGMFTGSGGKNKQDRSVYAGFSKAAFDKIALKAMPGR